MKRNAYIQNKFVQGGFTLVELMIVVAIVAILALVAYPSYQSYVISAKRGEMKAELQQLAQTIEKQKLAYKRYNQIPLSTLGFSDSTGKQFFPSSTNKNYELTISHTGNNINDDWVITATPDYSGSKSPLKGDGVIVINSAGDKCWNGTNSCSPSATTKWEK